MTRYKFLALVVASPLAVLFGRRKQDERYDIYMDSLPERQAHENSELLTAERMQALFNEIQKESGGKCDYISIPTTFPRWRLNES